MSRRDEWNQQVKLSLLIDKWLDPACTFWTATDPVASSAKSGAMRKKRGVKPGLPDTLILHLGKLVTLELKSRQGKCSASQRAAREALLRAGAEWWECRSANAAMWALRRSGVRFRTFVHNDGTTDRWRQPRLAPWEVPRRDPAEPRPRAPDAAARRRTVRRRWRLRQKAAWVTDLSAAAEASSPRRTGRGGPSIRKRSGVRRHLPEAEQAGARGHPLHDFVVITTSDRSESSDQSPREMWRKQMSGLSQEDAANLVPRRP